MFSALIDSRSRWFVGSSSRSTLGFSSMMRQKSSRAVSPPESASVGLRPSSPLKSIWPRRPWISWRDASGSKRCSHSTAVSPFSMTPVAILREVADRYLVPPLQRPRVHIAR